MKTLIKLFKSIGYGILVILTISIFSVLYGRGLIDDRLLVASIILSIVCMWSFVIAIVIQELHDENNEKENKNKESEK